MDNCLVKGERLLVVRKESDRLEEISATVLTDAGSMVALEFRLLYGQPVPVVQGESILLVRASGGTRAVASATVRSVQRPSAWFNVAEPGWQEEERRVAARAELRSPCEVAGRSPGAPRLAATLVDVSAAGLRVAAERHVGEARVDVSVDGPSKRVTLPCTLLAVEQVEDHVELRLRYERLTPAQQDVADWLMQARGAVRQPAA